MASPRKPEARESLWVTPRGYKNKYDDSGEVLPAQRPGYSLVLPAAEGG